MAKATVVRAEAPIEKVTLELSHEEAQALMNVLGAMTSRAETYVGNDPPLSNFTKPQNTYRIYDALYDVGYLVDKSGVAFRGPFD